MVWAFVHRLVAAAGMIAALGVPAMAGRVDTETVEFPAETEALVAATVTLFEEAEARGDRPARPTLSLTPTPAAADPASIEAFPDDHGPVRHLTGYRITWYPVDRLIGAVDFMGTWDNARNLVCGYVTWDVSDPDAPALQSLITTYVDISELEGMDDVARETALLEANCAFSDIDQNYVALD